MMKLISRVQIAAILILVGLAISVGSAQISRSAIFAQSNSLCPAVNGVTCGAIITTTNSGANIVLTGQGPYDLDSGAPEDTSVGVVNNSSRAITSLGLTSSGPIFSFDGDGLVSYGITGNSKDSSGYGGPNAFYTNINAAQSVGTVNFITPIAANGGTGYFSLEEIISATTGVSVNVTSLNGTPVPTATPAGPASCTPNNSSVPSGAFFDEEWNSLNSSVWSVNQNNYPTAVTVSGGFINVGTPGTSSLDFPYIKANSNPFPTTGDFTFEYAMCYTGAGHDGDGLVAVDANGAQSGIGTFQDSVTGLSYGVFEGGVDLTYHVYRWVVAGTTLTLILDGVKQYTITLPTRPTQLWFGHASIGQVQSTNPPPPSPGAVSSTGAVTSRWWSTDVWSPFKIDYIRTTLGAGTPTPTPTSTPAGGPSVSYSAGWNLVGGPAGTTMTGALSPLYTYQATDSAYEMVQATASLDAGKGYWAYFSSPTTVTLPSVSAQASTVPLPVNHYIMVGNPTNRPVTLSGANLVYTYTASAGYQSTTTLQPGQGAWVLSNNGGTLTITPQ